MKKFICTMLVMVMMISAIGCVTKDTDTSNADIKAEEYQKSLETNAKVYKKFIKIPDYDGLEVGVDMSILDVSDEEVNEYIQSVLNSFATTENVTTGVTKKDDVIILDYSGTLDGVAFSGGTATDVEYTVGSGKFITDLDKGLEGLTVGKEYKIPCTFPANYTPTDLANKDVIFTVTVTAIVKTVVPELTDAWVSENAEKIGTTETTVEGLKKSAREYLEAVAQIDFDSAKFASALKAITDKIEVKKYPEKEIASLKSTYKTNIETEYKEGASLYEYLGITSFSGYLKNYYNCEDEAAFDKLATEQAQNYLLEKMVITIIAADNGVTISADEIKELGNNYAPSNGYNDYNAMLESFGGLLNAELGYAVVSDKVLEIVNEKVKAVDKPATETESESASESASESQSATN